MEAPATKMELSMFVAVLLVTLVIAVKQVGFVFLLVFRSFIKKCNDDIKIVCAYFQISMTANQTLVATEEPA